MHVVVLGAGLVGVATAYYLARDGHRVTVLEREDGAALGTSYANAGLVAPGHAFAWASPAAPGMLLRSLWRDDQALRLKLRADPRMWAWMFRFLRECTAERAARNTKRKLKLCLYSQDRLHEVRRDAGIAYDGRDGGLLYLYRSQKAFDAAATKIEILRDGQQIEVIHRDRAAELDPTLAPVKELFAGALYAPADESGDARLFCQRLATYCEDHLGVTFRYRFTVDGIETEGDRVVAAYGSGEKVAGDLFVMALGCWSPALGRQLGLRIPIYPVKGYSVTVPVRAGHRPPTLGGVDEDSLVAYCPLGDRLRITATAEFSGFDTSHRPADYRTMLATARALFPDGADFDQPDYWAGLRPMTPQGSPLFGPAGYRNLHLNTGQGHMGWTMACGSGRIAADLIAGRDPGIDLDGMTYAA